MIWTTLYGAEIKYNISHQLWKSIALTMTQKKKKIGTYNNKNE